LIGLIVAEEAQLIDAPKELAIAEAVGIVAEYKGQRGVWIVGDGLRVNEALRNTAIDVQLGVGRSEVERDVMPDATRPRARATRARCVSSVASTPPIAPR
jgi:hypothetical protein